MCVWGGGVVLNTDPSAIFTWGGADGSGGSRLVCVCGGGGGGRGKGVKCTHIFASQCEVYHMINTQTHPLQPLPHTNFSQLACLSDCCKVASYMANICCTLQWQSMRQG